MHIENETLHAEDGEIGELVDFVLLHLGDLFHRELLGRLVQLLVLFWEEEEILGLLAGAVVRYVDYVLHHVNEVLEEAQPKVLELGLVQPVL